MAIDISGLGYFTPIFGFVFVFLIVYALLAKTKILGGNKWIDAIISIIIAVIFALTASAQEYVQMITPWFAVIAIILFLVLIIIGLSQQGIDKIMKPWFVWVFIAVLILVFLLIAIKLFPESLFFPLRNFMISYPRIFGAIVFLIIAAFAAWIVTKK